MCGINYIIKVPIWAVRLVLILSQLHFPSEVIEAKHYAPAPPYGDIDGNEQIYENNYNGRNAANQHYNPPNTLNYNGKYERDHMPVAAIGDDGRRRLERQKNSYQNTNDGYYNGRNNRNPNRNYPNTWLATSNMIEEQQNNNLTIEMSEDNLRHKCHIWVPMDALDKYPDAERKQDNKIAGSVYIEICCKGYAVMRWRGKKLCRPVCDNCQNGRCIAPGICECYEEFVANDNRDCVFTCPLGCLNGRCYLDGSCQCDPGYKLDETRKFCRPICSKGCGTSPLHNCTEPEICGCIKGYLLTDNDCQPVCQPECGIGGICRSPNVCECNPGYDLKDGVCQANCYQKCVNGMCYSPNRCICNPGFTYHERSTQCIPK